MTYYIPTSAEREYNLGDSIQTIALVENLKKADPNNQIIFIEGSDFGKLYDSYKGCGKRAIMAGWFSHAEEFLPPNEIDSLYISFCLYPLRARREIINRILNHHKSQIGCRDFQTLTYFGDKGYFSRCLTFTLPKFPESNRTDEILIVKYGNDIDDDTFVDYIPENIRKNSIELTHREGALYRGNPESNIDYARFRLKRYARAKLVITNLLHCAIPCVAMGTPVVFVNDFHPNVRQRSGAIAGVLPPITFDDLRKIDYSSIPTINISKLQYAISENFRLSCKQAFEGEDAVDLGLLSDIRDEIREFISDEYYEYNIRRPLH